MNTSVHNKYVHVMYCCLCCDAAPSVLEQQAASLLGSNYGRASCAHCQRINNKNKQSELLSLVIGKRTKLLK